MFLACFFFVFYYICNCKVFKLYYRKVFLVEKERKLCFHFVFRSLICTFAARNKIYFINSRYGKSNQIT